MGICWAYYCLYTRDGSQRERVSRSTSVEVDLPCRPLQNASNFATAIALPTIGHEFGLPEAELQWMVSIVRGSYVKAFSSQCLVGICVRLELGEHLQHAVSTFY